MIRKFSAWSIPNQKLVRESFFFESWFQSVIGWGEDGRIPTEHTDAAKNIIEGYLCFFHFKLHIILEMMWNVNSVAIVFCWWVLILNIMFSGIYCIRRTSQRYAFIILIFIWLLFQWFYIPQLWFYKLQDNFLLLFFFLFLFWCWGDAVGDHICYFYTASFLIYLIGRDAHAVTYFTHKLFFSV